MLGLAIDSSGTVRRARLPERGRIVLGRAAHCDVIVESEDVLPEHAAFERDGDGVRVTAITTGATLRVNDAEVTDAQLAEGAALEIGAIRIEVFRSDEAPSRLAGLSAFAEAAADAAALNAAGPVTTGEDGRRLLLEGLDDDLLTVFSDAPGSDDEARALRRLLAISRRLARAGSETELREGILDAALVLLAGDAGYLLAEADGDAHPAVLAARDSSGDVVSDAAERVSGPLLADALRDGVARDGAGGAAAVAVPFAAPEGGWLVVECARDGDRLLSSASDLLSALAEQAALALERVRLREDVVRHMRELLQADERAARLNSRLSDLLQRRTHELRETRAELARVDAAEGFTNRFQRIVGRGPATIRVLHQIDRVAGTTVPVLLQGDSGTGKELMARALHEASDRSAQRFVAENCAALPDTLLESELFGHKRGAFTGAETDSIGLFERADAGTLFLDEVGDMSPSLQKRLLRVLQEGEVRRVGGNSVRSVDVRIVTATNRDLIAMVREGTFREDLYYRLAVVKIRIPPLRERREDVPALVAHFLERFSDTGVPLQMTGEALEALFRHDWPGNVRELENEIRRAAALSQGPIGTEVLSPEVLESRPGVPQLVSDPVSHLDGRDLRELIAEVETRVLRAMLEREKGNITRTAAALGLSRLGLRKKMKRYGLLADRSRPAGGRATQVPR